MFIEEACIREPNARIQAGELYKEYKFWCEENGHHAMSSTRIAPEWKRLGFEKRTSGGKRYYDGVRMRLPGE